MKYRLTRKEIDIAIVNWERDYSRGKTTESLEMFIMHKQAENGLKYLASKGIKLDE